LLVLRAEPLGSSKSFRPHKFKYYEILQAKFLQDLTQLPSERTTQSNQGEPHVNFECQQLRKFSGLHRNAPEDEHRFRAIIEINVMEYILAWIATA
jgi:hypothetical protein